MVEQVLTKLLEAGKLNETTRFLIPILYTSDKTIDDNVIFIDEFKGASFGSNNDTYNNKLILTYAPTSEEAYNRSNKLLTENKYFENSFDTEDGNINYVFDVYDKNKEIVDNLFEGKYSEFSEAHKKDILKFWRLDAGMDPLYGILYKTDVGESLLNLFTDEVKERIAEGEYWPKPDIEKESL